MRRWMAWPFYPKVRWMLGTVFAVLVALMYAYLLFG
jgi:hypothetical protein